MKRYMKAYGAFAPKLCKYLLYAVYPLLILLGLVILHRWNIDGLSQLGIVFFQIAAMEVMISLEVMIDNWVFGGIYSKNSNNYELLKCSVSGQNFLKQALICDQIRRNAWGIIFTLVNFLLGGLIHPEGFGREVVITTLQFFAVFLLLANLGVMIGRWFDAFLANLIVIYIFDFLGLFIVFVLSFLPFAVLQSVLLLLCSVAVSVGSVWYAMKKFKESYSDERC